MDTTRTAAEDTDGPDDLPPAWDVTVVYHPDPAHRGARRRLARDSEHLLGRGKPLFGAGALDDADVSREHARIHVNTLDELTVADNDSRNGTFVNGRKITTRGLRDGDVISVGAIMLLVERNRTEEASDGPSAAHVGLLAAAQKVAAESAPVLLCGETGAGKDWTARAIHEASGRGGDFVVVGCGALAPEAIQSELFGRCALVHGPDDPGCPGLLEAAHGGTLYLDSIDDAAPALQSSLMGFLDAGESRRIGASEATPVDARIIASTCRTARDLADRGVRTELAMRLQRLVVSVPPLRHRRADILPMAYALAKQFSGRERELHRKLRLALLRHPYPGNIRELQAIIETLVVDHDDDAVLMLTSDVVERLQSADPTSSRISRVSVVETPLVVAVDGSWYRLDGQRGDLSNRATLMRIVSALAARRVSDPGQALTLDELLAAGWPGQRVIPEAGRNRVHVALTTLRKLGLRDVIVRDDDGYMLDPEIAVRVESE